MTSSGIGLGGDLTICSAMLKDCGIVAATGSSRREEKLSGR